MSSSENEQKARFTGTQVPLQDLPSIVGPNVFENLLTVCRDHNASDVIFRSGSTVRARVNGTLQAVTKVEIDKESIERFIQESESLATVTNIGAGHPRSLAYVVSGERRRDRYRLQATSVNEGMADDGIRLVARPISSRPPRLDDLNLPPDLVEALTTNRNKGIILVTGETGSGKSTVLGAALDQKARNEALHITTVEDPIEFNLFYLNDETQSSVSQSGLNTHVRSFPDAIKGLMRDNPDVIMVGELRDQDTIRLAAEASRTGHLVYSTLHVNAAAAVIDRICVSFPDSERMAIAASIIDALRTVLNQELVPKLCSCATPYDRLDSIINDSGVDLDGIRQPAGCDACNHTGYSGRQPLMEYVVLRDDGRDALLRELMNGGMAGVTHLLSSLVKKHGLTKLESAKQAVETGKIAPDVFKSVLVETQAMDIIAGGANGQRND
ncbi:type IV pilus twitching motility protein PilT [Marinobacterium stanieri]|uniref:Tfp pilus assembly protein PilT, pilus retraction ATPase n=1 Tax=Marinobacterium stanieri TaxID=49186 RepID=A0A1N6X880_9GAMM|nr:ATPase, T2SS/T4P/T4SS family [Marinobacterium stanieri]SIQ98562.1 Tfp pilus assembly protein PilT, pilus retraction ATPase [Marinobacterium stanieri]